MVCFTLLFAATSSAGLAGDFISSRYVEDDSWWLDRPALYFPRYHFTLQAASLASSRGGSRGEFGLPDAILATSTWTGGSANWSNNGNPGWNGTGVPNAVGATATKVDGVLAVTSVSGNYTAGTLLRGGSSDVSWIININNTFSMTLDQDGTGPGAATISNTNTNTGANNQFSLGGTGSLVLADDLLISNTGGSTFLTGALVITTAMAGSGNVTFSNVNTGITQTGAIRLGSVTIHTYTGAVLMQRGTVVFSTTRPFGDAANVVTLGQAGQGSAAALSVAVNNTIPNPFVIASGTGGTLTLGGINTGASTYSGTVTLNGDVSLNSEVTNTAGLIFNNAISGVGALTKTGAGILTLSGPNTYGGNTILAAGNGTLLLSNTDALQNSTLNYTGSSLTFSSSVATHAFTLGGLTGSANIAMQDNAGTPNAVALSVGNNNGSPAAYSGNLSAGGSLTKVGLGTLTLASATGNTYSGGTAINAGTLLVTNTSGSGTGASLVAVNNSGSVLGGTGFIAGGVTINPDACLLGGNGTAATGTLTLSGALTLNSGSIIELALGAFGAHSTLARTGAGTWLFDATQAFTFIDLGAVTATTYDNIITGLAADPGTEGAWTIQNLGWAGTFIYDGTGNIDLTLTAVPEPSTWAAGILASAVLAWSQRRRFAKPARGRMRLNFFATPRKVSGRNG